MIRFVTFFFCLLLAGIPVSSKNKIPKEKKFPLTIQYNGQNETPLIFHITGDGGAVRFDLKMFREYQKHGFSFIGLNSLKYFSSKKNPETVAREMIPVIREYCSSWQKKDPSAGRFFFWSRNCPILV